MRHVAAVLLLGAVMSLPAHAAQPVPDPRLDPYYNMIAIATIHRSVELDRTVPPLLGKAKPQVRESDMREVRDGVFVERSLLPRSGAAEDERGVIRVFPRDRQP